MVPMHSETLVPGVLFSKVIFSTPSPSDITGVEVIRYLGLATPMIVTLARASSIAPPSTAKKMDTDQRARL